MKPWFDGLYSIDLPDGPPQLPEDPTDCWIVIQLDIGFSPDSGADTFTIYVTTPRRLRKIVAESGPQFGTNMLVVEEFSWETIENAIRKKIDLIEGANWEELSNSLSKFADWEFENYDEES